MLWFHIGMFLCFQVVANLFFKWGSLAPSHYWWGFALGNAVGMTSIIFMLGMYRAMPAAAHTSPSSPNPRKSANHRMTPASKRARRQSSGAGLFFLHKARKES